MDIFSADINCCTEEMLQIASKELYKKGYVKESFIKSVIDRERTNPTGLQVEDLINVAIPHTDIEHVIHPTIVIVKKNDQSFFTFHRLDEPDKVILVSVVFLLVVKEPSGYVDFLADLTGLFQESEFINLLLINPANLIGAKLVEKLSKYELTYKGDLINEKP
ncbi:MAG: PTS transporter subunit EIIA [Anaerolineae bacterium]|nr:PTS transporter subunit EIIA [Anaerolineae bacterium]